jgi:hypothetical protein
LINNERNNNNKITGAKSHSCKMCFIFLQYNIDKNALLLCTSK